ncbi:putative glycosomal membrane protein [Trypanosoma grayi]|uniref:putative glycosomal membrane protein n=1 Tax=Trypanosoma grayi TaxID=71804 RepID=UPI0004F40DC2|nr:putative glycosomal membrane protein [Trypanosoma grayi]KEG14356.1 putative glycosomal membrane protein [Trypanosoma grayi]
MEVTARCLASVDSLDKLLQGAGALVKIVYAFLGVGSLREFAYATSDARSLMRLLSWLSNVQVVSHALGKDQIGMRDVLYLIHIAGEGVFKVCDNVAYLARKTQGSVISCHEIVFTSRLGLFGACFAAVLISLFDMRCDRHFRSRSMQCIQLFQNLCDLLVAASAIRCAGFELNFVWKSVLMLMSAFIGCVDCFRAAAIRVK